jgi:ubiquinone/menaquinone biosynthesis C-methylase UbiE
MSREVRHPIFARLYHRMTLGEDPEAEAHRRELLAGLRGRVVEVGAGNGANFAYYPETVREVVAVEPEDYLRARAEEAAAAAPVTVSIVDGLADRLTVADASVDAAVTSLVLCSVPEQASALAEIWRVLKPGGELRFYEHVLSDEAGFARIQRVFGRVWPHLAGGCHPDRDTAAEIERAGFRIETCRRFDYTPAAIAPPVRPHILGRAIRP